MPKPRLSKGVTALEDADLLGGQLMWMLVYRAKRLGITQKEVAEILGITRAYLEALMWGRRPVSEISADILKKIAEFIDAPVSQVYLLSGILKISDFSTQDNLDHRMLSHFKTLQLSNELKNILPDEIEWSTWPLELRLSICFLLDGINQTNHFAHTQISSNIEKKQVQNDFLNKLRKIISENNWTINQTADYLSISVTFLRGILNQKRPLTALKRVHIEKLAEILKQPIAQIYVSTGILCKEDFQWNTTIESRVNASYETMRIDKIWNGITPSLHTWNIWPLSGKILMTQLYESGARTNPVMDIIQAADQITPLPTQTTQPF
ncbi:helix-turn-helix transcriptional regulator [Chromobacterium sp. IIBBL 290-4]|uniref:helix-turn-helix transcriptional regulator n=1 Tax=Chromobacterium sp. IIBBL 290-4 TaxID=2953890 RepID=UPI0020B77F18|nr:helix-turn-helix transcriptional regulator [Chromobacterium sp. IIBBL 290-4]UTH74226.1 transcriptional regulator [Chromobacterium sp. IIBBL 290-4]